MTMDYLMPSRRFWSLGVRGRLLRGRCSDPALLMTIMSATAVCRITRRKEHGVRITKVSMGRAGPASRRSFFEDDVVVAVLLVWILSFAACVEVGFVHR